MDFAISLNQVEGLAIDGAVFTEADVAIGFFGLFLW